MNETSTVSSSRRIAVKDMVMIGKGRSIADSAGTKALFAPKPHQP
jgi:hypothetical protein